MAAIEFTIRRKIITFFGAKFHLYNADGSLLGFVKQKAFKLKEDIRVFTDETTSEERLLIRARSAIDFSAAYDVIDSSSGEKVGALRRKGLTSMVRDEWMILDEQDGEVGSVRESSSIIWSLVKRAAPIGIPQKYIMHDTSKNELATFKQNFNPFVQKLAVKLHDGFPLHPLMGLATGVLLIAIEGRQE